MWIKIVYIWIIEKNANKMKIFFKNIILSSKKYHRYYKKISLSLGILYLI